MAQKKERTDRKRIHATQMEKNNINFLQVNLGRARAGHDMMMATALTKEIDILLTTEPNKKIVNTSGWLKDQNSDAAIYIRNKAVKMRGFKSAVGWIRLDLENFSIYSCYLSPNIAIRNFEEALDEIMNDVRIIGRESVITGDFNSKSPVWGSPSTDTRGDKVVEWLATMDLTTLNDGNPTFVRGASHSHIDITLATNKIARKIKGWEVMEEESLSFHKYIGFSVEGTRTKERTEKRRLLLNPRKFVEELEARRDRLSEGAGAKQLTQVIGEAQRAATTDSNGRNRTVPYWWNMDIEAKRKGAIATRRRITRGRERNATEQEIEAWEENLKALQKELKNLIRKAKKHCWKELCEKVQHDIWGQGYSIAVREFKKPTLPGDLTNEEKMKIARDLFPEIDDELPNTINETHAEKFTRQELEAAAERMKPGKAPGPDRVLPEAVKLATKIIPEEMLAIYNKLLKEGDFPKEWKRAKLVLIPKGKVADGGLPKFRPICLLDTLGKLYEGMVKVRLEEELGNKRAISENQFGFRAGKSTIQAVKWVLSKAKERSGGWCAFIALDIKNAFNTAVWSLIVRNLELIGISHYIRKVISDYLTNRRVGLGGENIPLTAGVPQGSVLGPTLWNVLYNGVLELELPEGCSTVAFADDLGLVVASEGDAELEVTANVALQKIQEWMVRNRLTMAKEKTESVILKGRRRREHVRFNIEGVEIVPQKTVKYLGIHLDGQLNFGSHVKETAAKAERSMAALCGIMPNVGGATSSKRVLLYRVMESIVLYGAPVWSSMVEQIPAYRNKLNQTQRKGLMRVISSYRTVSTEALQTIAGIPPMDLLAKERRLIYESGRGHDPQMRTEIRTRTMTEWQDRWDQLESKAQWTKRLIPNLSRWVECKHREVGYFLTQFLSGHGSFRTFTHRIGKDMDNHCLYCGETDTPEHTVFQCPRWGRERESFLTQLGIRVDAGNIVEIMINSKENYKNIKTYIDELMKRKDKEERIERQAQND